MLCSGFTNLHLSNYASNLSAKLYRTELDDYFGIIFPSKEEKKVKFYSFVGFRRNALAKEKDD